MTSSLTSPVTTDPAIALAGWATRLARAGEALERLTQSEAFLRLRAASRTGSLDGATAAAATKAIADADALWRSYLALDRNVEQAKALAANRNPFGADARRKRIAALLDEAAMDDPQADADLANLSLGASRTQRIALADLFTQLEGVFGRTRDAVVKARDGWAAADRLDARQAELDGVTAEAATLGIDGVASAKPIAAKIAAARAATERDPIGAADAAQGIESEIEAMRRRLDGARADRAEAERALVGARTALTALQARRAMAAAKRERRLRAVRDPQPGAPLPPDGVDALMAWLDRLDQAFAAHRYKACRIGVASLQTALTREDAGLAAAITEDERALEVREDLRARLLALKPRVERAARNGADTALDTFAKARALLFDAPTPLPEAVAAVKRCEAL